MMLKFGRARLSAIVVFLVCLLAGIGAVYADVNLPTSPKKGPVGTITDLLAPVKNMLSGRPWLMLEGIDPGLRRKPEWSSLTGLDWSSLNLGSQMSGMTGAPAMQAVGGFLVPFRSAAPAFSRDVLISRDYSSIPIQTEPHIAAHPDDPDHAVVGMIDYNFPSITSYVTLDGGSTWEGPYQVGYLPDDLGSGGDPVVGFDRDGNVYMCTISIGEEEFSIGPVVTSSLVSSIAVARSDDGGFTWPTIVSTDRSDVELSEQQIDPSGRLRGNVSIGFLDKPWLTVGRHPTDRNRDVVYVTYTDFEIYYQILYTGELPLLLSREMASTIKLVVSEDGGLTWSDPIAVSPTVRRVFGSVDNPPSAPGMFGSDRVVQGSRPVVDRYGNLYVSWIDSTDDGSMEGLGEIYVTRSSDGGKTFSTPVNAAVYNEIPFRPRNAYFRYWASAFPRLAAGAGGELYLVFTARPAEKLRDDGDVFFIRSFDRGKTWSNPERLNDDDGDNLQFFPEVDVDPEGVIHVMWGDMRDDPIQTSYHIYYTQSDDRGNSWGFEVPELNYKTRDTRVTDFPSNPNRGFPNGLFIGDYFSLEATGDDVYMVWADSRLGEFGGINQKIGFTRQRAIRSPDIFVSPSAGPGGQSITVQGFNFQPNMSIIVQLQDATIATSRTNAEGRFTAGIFVPVTGEGPQSLRVFDESGNFASTSFYTEFGFNNIEQLYRDLLEEMQDLSKKLDGEG
jgi:hypothetical protein